jgi:hypothetical protein
MFLTSSILLGFIRLVLIILFLYFLKTKFVKRVKNDNFLDFVMVIWFRYSALILILIFVLVLAKAYNMFNIFLFLIVTISIDIIGIRNLKTPIIYFNTTIKKEFLSFLKKTENKTSIRSWFLKKDASIIQNNQAPLLMFITIFLVLLTFFSRYYFIIHDNYSLSEDWINDLHGVVKFDSQEWFDPFSLSIDGELAFVNYYSKLTNVSPEIALQVNALLVASLLSIIIFWTIHKLTSSKFVAPIIASLTFSLVYVLTPINVYYMLKTDQTSVALTFAFPIFVYYMKPRLLKITKLSFFASWYLGFLAIGLIDLFTLLILIPPFLILGFVFSKMKNKVINLIGIASYLFSIATLLVIYSIQCNYQSADLLTFLHANLIHVSSYIYIPQVIVPFLEIIRYMQYGSLLTLILIFPLLIFKNENWRNTIVFLLFFNFLILLTMVKSIWIDNEMVINSLAIFMPLALGFMLASVCRIANFVLYPLQKYSTITVFLLISLGIYFSINYQEKQIKSLLVSNQTPKQILDAYDKITQTYFPYSYAVVNDPATQIISENKHFFINYDFFLKEYATIDSIYFKHHNDKKFVINNPEYSLPKTVLVFVLNEKNLYENNVLSKNKKFNSQLNKQLLLLKKRGRKVNLFYSSAILKVYEIVNEPNVSKINDLMF